MTLRSASYSLKYTEITPITAVRKVYLSVRRQCLSRPIERRNLWKRVTSISFVLVSETCTVLTISFLQSLKLKEWSIERGNLWKKSLELLRSGKALVHRLGLCSMNKDERSSQNVARKFLIKKSKQLEQNKNTKFYKKNYGVSNWNFVKFINKVLQRWRNYENSKVLHSIRSARQKLIEDQNTIMELSGRLQELQNEVNCMNDSKDFQDAESVRSGNSHVTSRPVSFPPHAIPEGMLRPSFVSPRRKEGPPCIWDTHGISGNVFANPHASSSAPYPQELNSLWKKTIEEPIHMSTAEKSERPERDQDLRCQSGPSAKDSVIFSGGDYSKNYGADQQRLQISDLHFDKFPTPATFACWKIRFKTEVCTCSQFPTEAMQWIKEVELVDSVDELRSSSSTRGIPMPNFEVLDARIASALNKIIHNSQFKRRISLEEQKAQEEDRFLRGRQIAYLIYDHFRVTGSHDSVENYTDLFTIVLRNDGIQEFDSKWDGMLLSMTKIPHDVTLEGLYKLRIRESEKLKTVLELYDLETHQKKLGPDYHRLKTMVKRSIEQEIRNKNFGSRIGNFEKNAVVKNQGTKQRVQRILGDCWQWETNGQCVKGNNCSFRHDMNKRGKSSPSNPSPNSFMRQNERKPSRTRSPRGKSPSGRMSRWPCKDYLGGTCNNSFCEKWHPPECLYYKTKSGCRFGEKCAFAHRQVDEQPTKRSKTNNDKSAVAMLKKGNWQESVTDGCHDRTGQPVKRSDKKLGQNSSKR